MKHLPLFFFILLFASCQSEESNLFRLKGNLQGLTDTVVYLYPAFSEPDTLIEVPVRQGKFSNSFPLDTVHPFCLYIGSLDCNVVLFAESGETLEVKGDTSVWSVSGGGNLQAEWNEFFALAARAQDYERELHLADSFISTHPHSEVSLYLIERYFLQARRPDEDLVNRLLDRLSGNMQDHPYVNVLRGKSGKKTTPRHSRMLPVVSLPDTTGKPVVTNDLKGKYVVVNFWASWDEASRERQKQLDRLVKKYAKQPVVFLNVSLDVDRQAWISAIKEDTLAGVQVCDFKGWGSAFVKQSGVSKLPHSLVRNKGKDIIATDQWESALEVLLDGQLKAR